mmetsp:Transcript_3266/g.5376  ORF Transcript_3266/g.5376 Transcript_3266/m.5376 type:complete len:220 (-) Transcript_3266:734-1393(-)
MQMALTKYHFFLCFAFSLFLTASQCEGIILKVGDEECIEKDVKQNEPVFGSFVSIPNEYGFKYSYDLLTLSPTGKIVHDIHDREDDLFNFNAEEAGKYRFCLRLHSNHKAGHFGKISWELLIALNVEDKDHANAQEVHEIWKQVNRVDTEIQRLKTTQRYFQMREERHRFTVESTKRRILGYAILRSMVVVLVSASQVLLIRWLFNKSCFPRPTSSEVW